MDLRYISSIAPSGSESASSGSCCSGAAAASLAAKALFDVACRTTWKMAAPSSAAASTEPSTIAITFHGSGGDDGGAGIGGFGGDPGGAGGDDGGEGRDGG